MDIQQLKQFNLLLIGDGCYDVYHFGNCTRLSPEAPVPIFTEHRTEIRPGMCLNVERNLQGLSQHVTTFANKEEIKKERFIEENYNHHLLRLDKEPEHIVPYVFKSEHLTKNLSAVVISDYDKGFITHNNAKALVSNAIMKQIPVFVDSKKRDLSCFENCTIKINSHERERVETLPKQCELITTAGKHGAYWNDFVFPAVKTEIFDVCGAGDVFLSGLVCSYLHKKSLAEAIIFANKCASISVSHAGTYAIQLEDLR